MRQAFEDLPDSDVQVGQDGKLRIGPFVFAGDISKILKRRLRHLYRPIKNKVQSLRLQNGRLHELMPEDALQLAQSYTFQYLSTFKLFNNKLQSINFLKKCHFPNLIVLDLSGNHIQSMTDICNHLNFPYLQELELSNNHITTLRGLRRWSLPLLTRLTFDLNFIEQITQIEQAHLPSLRQLVFYSNNIRDFKPIFKTNFTNLSSIYIYQNETLNQELIFNLLTTKFKFLETAQANDD